MARAVPSSKTIRATLTARCINDELPVPWRVAATSAGVSGADAFLCHLSRSIVGALERLAASAEAARLRVIASRDARDVRTMSHCDELESRIESAETSKRVALERELCAVDAVLERLRAVRGTAVEAAASMGDAELETWHTELTARLDVAVAQLLALPTNVVEIPHVGVVIDEAALLAGAAVFGRVVAPRAITAANLTLLVEGTPSSSTVYPGCTLYLRLMIQSELFSMQSAEELEICLVAASAATHVEATLETTSNLKSGAPPLPLQAECGVNIPRRCVSISITVPQDAPFGSSVCFGPLNVNGQPVAGLLGPILVKVRESVRVRRAQLRCTSSSRV